MLPFETRYKLDRPDEVFKAPGLKIERRGRHTTVETHRTPQQQRRLIENIVARRPGLIDEISKATEEVVGMPHKFNSLESVAHLWVMNSFRIPNG